VKLGLVLTVIPADANVAIDAPDFLQLLAFL
jgi:hypothetical protein